MLDVFSKLGGLSKSAKRRERSKKNELNKQEQFEKPGGTEVKTENIIAWVASLHLHPLNKGGPIKGGPMTNEKTITLVENQGIVGDHRHFGRLTSKDDPSPRQVSIIDRSQLRDHAMMASDPDCLGPGRVRSNIETITNFEKNGSINEKDEILTYIEYIGRQLQIGKTAIVEVTLARKPCWQMDIISQGLKRLMSGDRQGILCKVITSGDVQIGDPIVLLPE